MEGFQTFGTPIDRFEFLSFLLFFFLQILATDLESLKDYTFAGCVSERSLESISCCKTIQLDLCRMQ
jgi:hypothetical protein